MKWTFLVGILGLAIGFLVGRSQEEIVENEERKVVAKSERRVASRGGRSRDGRDSEEGRSRAERMIREAGMSEEEMTEISRARLMKWILELEAGDFPEVLEELKKLGGSNNDDPFATDSGHSDYLTVAMGRWYELEGEVVLDWVLAGPKEIRGEDQKRLMSKMIEDGYRRDPDRSFDLMKKYVGTSERIPGSWLYQMGKWSLNFEREFEELMTKSTDEEPEPNLPFTFDNVPVGKMRSFARGMIDGGREAELREWLGEEAKVMDMLDSMLEQKKVKKFKEEGWQALKGAIDRGDIKGREHDYSVLWGFWQDDENAAIDWYLGHEVGAEKRAEMIRNAAVVMSQTPQDDHDPFYSSGIGDLDRAIVFLNEMKGRGEPVDKAWANLANWSIEARQWDQLEAMKSHLPLNVWNEAVTGIERAGLNDHYVYLGKTQIKFQEFNENGEVLLERFGMKERVLEKVANQNEQSLRKLHQIMGLE